MKALKYLLYAVGGLVVLAVIVVIAAALLFDPNKMKGEIERVVKQDTGRTLKLEGDLHFAFWPSIGASVGRASLSERGSATNFASIDSAHVAVALLPLLRGKTLVDKVSLSGLTVNLVKRADGSYNFDDLLGAPAASAAKRAPAAPPSGPAAPAASPSGNVQFDISGIRIERASVSYRDLKSGTQIAVNDLHFATGRVASGVPGKIELSADVKGVKPQLDGRIELSTGYRFDAQARTAALSGLDAKMTAASAALPQKRLTVPISGSAQADFAKGTAHAELTAKLEDSTIRAKLGAQSFTPASYNFDVDIDRLNVDRYLAADSAQLAGGGPKSAGAAQRPSAAAAPVPIDLSWLKGLQARGRLRIGQLQAEGLKLAEVKTEVRAANGHAELAPHSAKLYEGALSGALALDANANRVSLNDKLENISIGPLLKDFAERDLIEGRGNVALDVQAAGKTVEAMKKSLAGTARVALHDGAIKGFNLAETLRKVKALAGSQGAQAQSVDQAQKTDFSELTASFVIRNGVAHNDDLNLKAPLFRVTGSGDINVAASRIDYTAKAAVVGTTQGQGGKELAELRGVTVPVRLVGPFDAMKYEVDYRAVAREAVKSQAAKKLEERLGGKEGLEEKLRGLLRR